MNFYPHAAFAIPKQENGLVVTDKKSLSAFWDELDEKAGCDLSNPIGCYIFSIRASKGALPWYVGLAEKQSFRKECFTPHKINHYNNAVANRKGTPMLTLVAKRTPSGKLISPTGGEHRDIQHLEPMLIAKCLGRNPGLLNMKDTKLLREMVVPGLINGGHRRRSRLGHRTSYM